MSAQQKDADELTDHPLYPRRDKAEIFSKKVSYTNNYNLIKKYREVTQQGDELVNDFKLMTVKGKLTRIKYFVPAWRFYVEHDSLLKMFCGDLIFMHEFAPPNRSFLDVFVPYKDGFYPSLGQEGDRIPDDNFYFVLSRFKDGNKVYIIITGSYKLYREGNYYTVDVIETKEKQFISTYEIGYYLKKEGTVNLISILFKTNSYEIRPESRKEVKFLAEFLKSAPEIKIRIGGHTDNIGDTDYNQKLSENRAKSLKTLLVEDHGIETSRLSTIGFGENKPISNANTEEGRALNRRVEITMMK